MDCVKIGNLISKIRKEKKLTQKQIADALGIQSKTVSKWECGLGCPDLSLWLDLSTILGVDMKQLMEGEIVVNKPDIGNIDKVKFYVCSTCGNILASTGSASIFCCGRKLEASVPMVSTDNPNINVEVMESDYYITFDHPMTKAHYISFVAMVKSDKVMLTRLYPEQNAACRVPLMYGSKLYAYCIKDGLSMYKLSDYRKK